MKKNACNGKCIIIMFIYYYCYYYYYNTTIIIIIITPPQMSLLQYIFLRLLLQETESALIQRDYKALCETGSVNKFESNLHCKQERSNHLLLLWLFIVAQHTANMTKQYCSGATVQELINWYSNPNRKN